MSQQHVTPLNTTVAAKFNFEAEAHHEEGAKLDSIEVVSAMLEAVLDNVFLKVRSEELEEYKGPFATRFTKEYFRKAMKQSLFHHDQKTDD